MTMQENPYLVGTYRPVSAELTALALPVTGRIPDELTGRYLRNGPNPLTAPEPATYHWFSGEGMVHGVRLRDGRADWYRNRWVRSARVATALGEPTRPGPVHAGMDFAPNTNVIGHAGRTLALVEGGALPYELTDELETIGPTDLGATLDGGYTAHPKRDPVTGELHAISYFWGWGNKVRYTVLGVDGRIRRSVDIEVGGPVSIHDLSITASHVIIYDLPVVFSPDLIRQGIGFPYAWDPGYQARLGVLRHEAPAEDICWFDIDPCYVFHPLNAYEDDESLVLDVVRHESVFAIDKLGPGDQPPALERWTLDLASGTVKQEGLDDQPQEFPRIDERLIGRRHRYGYTAMVGAPGSAETAVIKHDFAKAVSEERPLGSGSGPSEPVFVPRHPEADEADGWVLCLSYDHERDASDLLVINAADFTGQPEATIHLPARVPVGFHGNWIPDPNRD